jgi:hypothetical protein
VFRPGEITNGTAPKIGKTGLLSMGRSMGSGRAFYKSLACKGFPGDSASLRLRSTFRDRVAECTNYPTEMAEMSLAHAVDDRF